MNSSSEGDGRGRADIDPDLHQGQDVRRSWAPGQGRFPVQRSGLSADRARERVLERQEDRFGGIQWGAGFFGWLAATAATFLLIALAAAAGTAFGLARTADEAVNGAAQAAQDPATARTVDIAGAVTVLVIVLVAYYGGGYVAGRMARFNGIRQGIAVWLWAVITAFAVAILTAVAGSKYNILSTLNGLPRLPVEEGSLTYAGIATAIIALAAALLGAILGGLAGMHYHRKIDRTGYDR